MKDLTPFHSLLLIVCALLLLPGCGNLLKQPAAEKQTFIMDTTRPGTETEAEAPVLHVRPVHVATTFSQQLLVYRLTEVEYERDYYNNWLVAPAEMVRELTTDWLRAAGVGFVGQSGSLIDVDHVIEMNVEKLYGDYRPELAQPVAVVEIRFVVIPFGVENPEPDEGEVEQSAVTLSRTYRETVPLIDKHPETLVQALSMAFGQVLARFEEDLQRAL